MVQSYVSGLAAAYKGWKTEYEAYVAYQECLLRGEVERINLPGDIEKEEDDDKGDKGDEDKGDEGDDDKSDESDEYFPEELWPPEWRVSTPRQRDRQVASTF